MGLRLEILERGSPSLEKRIGISVFERLVCYEYHLNFSIDVLCFLFSPFGSSRVSVRIWQGDEGQGWKLDCRF